MTSSKLSRRRYNAGTPPVTRASRCIHRIPGHSVDCDVTPAASPVPPLSAVSVDFWNDDPGLPAGQKLDKVDITISGGSWTPPPPWTFYNSAVQGLTWNAPADPGHYTIKAIYWWSDGDSCEANNFIDVVP